nr:TetR/AcrR family transcriptional regulator [Oscillospiraceae bacterium]
MYKLCKTEESSKRQREIEGVLLRLMTLKGYDDITVSEICEAASLPRKSFYRYFDGKEGAMQSLLYHTMTDFQTFSDVMNNNTSDNKKKETRTLQGEFEGFFAFWKSKKDFLDAFDKSKLIGLLVENATGYAMSEFVNIQKFLTEGNERERQQVFQFTICGLMTLTIDWYRSGFAETVPTIARTAARLISKPLFPDLDKMGIQT